MENKIKIQEINEEQQLVVAKIWETQKDKRVYHAENIFNDEQLEDCRVFNKGRDPYLLTAFEVEDLSSTHTQLI